MPSIPRAAKTTANAKPAKMNELGSGTAVNEMALVEEGDNVAAPVVVLLPSVSQPSAERVRAVTSVPPTYEFVPLRVSVPAPTLVNPEVVDQVELCGDRNGPIGPLEPALRTSEMLPAAPPAEIVPGVLPPLKVRTLVVAVALVHVAEG